MAADPTAAEEVCRGGWRGAQLRLSSWLKTSLVGTTCYKLIRAFPLAQICEERREGLPSTTAVMLEVHLPGITKTLLETGKHL